MIKKIERNYLEINTITELKESNDISQIYSIDLLDPYDFQINKFFYKNVGKKHQWVDRLVWTEKQWIDYVSNKRVRTYILKNKDDLAGYFELILHKDINEIEIVSFLKTFIPLEI